MPGLLFRRRGSSGAGYPRLKVVGRRRLGATGDLMPVVFVLTAILGRLISNTATALV
ncbi:hypothetical protein [Microlunatus endophyticus]|uniref:hypothetical protein n=1 Tax=Microlunatus endophyticus TaxID=1716077 RepID=UPI00166A1BB8|nr:hypothetical protein [Microlunatus endophyticus]